MGTVLPSYLLVLLFHFSPIRKTAPLSFVPPRQLSHTAQVPTRHSLGASSNQEDSFVAATAMKKRTIKAVLFDMDGTLLDTETLSDKAVFQTFGDSLPPSVAQTHNHRLPWEIKEPTLGLQGHAWIPLVLQYAHDNWGVAVKKGEESDLPPAPSVAEFWERWEATLNSFCPDVKACAGAPELVEAFASQTDLRLAIATSSRRVAVDAKQTKHDRIFQHIEEIVTGDDPSVKNGKPAPDIYIEAARRLDVHPSECLVFEDAVAGAKAGMAAGCLVVAVPDPRMDKSLFDGHADIVLDSMWEFNGEEICGVDVNMLQHDAPKTSSKV